MERDSIMMTIGILEFKQKLEFTKLLGKVRNLPITLDNLTQIKGLFINHITDHSSALDCSSPQSSIPHNFALYHDDEGKTTISVEFPEMDNLHINCMAGLFHFLIDYCPRIDAVKYLKEFVPDTVSQVSDEVLDGVFLVDEANYISETKWLEEQGYKKNR